MSAVVKIDIIGTDRASTAFDRAAASADRAAGKIMAAGKRMDEAGRKLTHVLTLPILAAVGASADLATKFQAAMEKIHTQAGGSQQDVKLLSREVLNLAKSAQQGPVELANSLYHLKSVGMDNAKAMQALGQATKLAAVGGADLESTTNALAGAWRTGIAGAKNFHTAVATVNAIIGAGNMRMDDFVAAIGTGILPAAKTFGLSLKQVGAALALLTDEGTPAAAAATRLRMSFSLLGAPSAAAEKWLNQIHLTGLKLATTMRTPGTGLIDAISLLKTKLDASGLSAAKQSQILSHAFGGGRSGATIMSLVNNLDVLKKKQEQVNGSIGKFGAAVKAQAETAQAKFKLMVSSLERAAINLGNLVLPWITKLATGVGDMAEKFNSLPKSSQKMILWGALAVAALGPLLRILGNVTRAIGLLAKTSILLGGWAVTAVRAIGRVVAGFLLLETSTAAYESTAFAMGFKVRSAFSSMGTTGVASMKLLGSAMAGAAIGYGLGQISKHADTTTKVLDTLGGAAAGAAMGMAVGGPLGAAVGGLTGLVGGLAANFLHTGPAANAGAKAARAAMMQEKADAQDLFGTLQSVNGAYSQMYRQQLADKLGASGALGIAKQAGVQLPQLMNTLLGNKNGAFGWAQLTAQLENAYAAGNITYAQMEKLVGVVHHLAPAAAEAEKRFQLENEAMGKSAVSARLLGVGMNKLKDAFKGTGTSLDDVSAAGQRNRAVMKEEIGALNSASGRALAHGVAIGKVTKQYEGNVSALKKNLVAMGFQKSKVEELIRTYARTPKQIVTKVLADAQSGRGTIAEFQSLLDSIRQHKVPGLSADNAAGKEAIQELQDAIDRLRGKSVNVDVNTRYNTYGTPAKGGGRHYYAAGGYMAEGESLVGERGPELVTKHGSTVHVTPADQTHEKLARQAIGLLGRPSSASAHAALPSGGNGKIAENLTIVEAQNARATGREIVRQQRRRAAV